MDQNDTIIVSGNIQEGLPTGHLICSQEPMAEPMTRPLAELSKKKESEEAKPPEDLLAEIY